MVKPKTDDANEITLYRTRRKEISARYYQRNREVIKLAMTFDISMKQARAIYASAFATAVKFGKESQL